MNFNQDLINNASVTVPVLFLQALQESLNSLHAKVDRLQADRSQVAPEPQATPAPEPQATPAPVPDATPEPQATPEPKPKTKRKPREKAAQAVAASPVITIPVEPAPETPETPKDPAPAIPEEKEAKLGEVWYPVVQETKTSVKVQIPGGMVTVKRGDVQGIRPKAVAEPTPEPTPETPEPKETKAPEPKTKTPKTKAPKAPKTKAATVASPDPVTTVPVTEVPVAEVPEGRVVTAEEAAKIYKQESVKALIQGRWYRVTGVGSTVVSVFPSLGAGSMVLMNLVTEYRVGRG